MKKQWFGAFGYVLLLAGLVAAMYGLHELSAGLTLGWAALAGGLVLVLAAYRAMSAGARST